MNIQGLVHRVEESTYDYADIKDDNYKSLLAVPLLKYEGKYVRVTIEEITEGEKSWMNTKSTRVARW